MIGVSVTVRAEQVHCDMSNSAEAPILTLGLASTLGIKSCLNDTFLIPAKGVLCDKRVEGVLQAWLGFTDSLDRGATNLSWAPTGIITYSFIASNSTVVADLQIYNVEEIHFTLTFTVKFNISNDIKEESVRLTKENVSGSSGIEGTSLLLGASLALTAKYFAKSG
ncbi:hypothetical protein CHS0354_026188 [Potamilus streckersoni]|uniref:Uncharacterized protein n=1 Tax=Potamilus streckersoni TaxID=2493646 RepID=A0AAE0SUZ5_9BIVA|nr:hypothetical protein CHS0354_026188 [Potamilus streckersoni]